MSGDQENSEYEFVATPKYDRSKSCGLEFNVEDLKNVGLKRQFDHVDSILNEVYSQRIASCSAKEKPRLVDTERKWTAFRDAHCLAISGNKESDAYLHAMIDLTTSRTKQLQDAQFSGLQVMPISL